MSSKTKTTATKEESRPARVPKLRFPEFREAEGWEYAQLGKLLERSPDYGVNAAAVPFTERLPQYLRITDISDDGTYLSAKKVSVDLEPTEEIYLDEGDIVLARTGASVGKSYRYRKEDGRLVFAGFLIRVKPNPKRLDSSYLANFLTTEQYWKWVAATSARSGQPGINSVEYSSLAIPLPADFTEQQKIAKFLSSVDELMAAQARKVDALKTHKKGLMQQLFPRISETQPRLRFPEFQNAGEWKERLLGTLIEEFQGKSTIQDEYEVMTSARSGLVRQREYYDNDRITERDNIGFNVIPPNYITYRSRSDDRQFYFNENNLGITGIVSVYYPVFRVVNGSNRFLFELLSAFSRVVGKYSVGTSQTVLSLNQLGRIRLPFPPTEKEQQRIALCLSSLDALITAETQQFEALKTHKKGLMQQLFPSSEEATDL